jgi:small-conductance mechanosensitive channel
VKTKKLQKFSAALAAAFLIVLIAPCLHSANEEMPSADLILEHLNAVINWYRNLTGQIPAGQEPSDEIYLANAQNLGQQVVRLAFQSARALAAIIELQSPSNGSASNSSGQNYNNDGDSGNNSDNVQRYAQFERQVTQRIADEEAQLNTLKEEPPKSRKTDIKAQRESLEGRLALDQATLDTVRQMKRFVQNNNSGATGLDRSINELARSVPEVFDQQLAGKTGNTLTQTKAPASPSSGLIGQLMSLYGEMETIRSIEQRLSEIDNVQQIANGLRGPLRQELQDTLQQGKNLATQSGVTKEQYDALTQKFKQLSAASLPLSEEIVVLDQSRSNLLQWRKAHTNESRILLIGILTRVALVLAAVGIIFGLAEAWRRLTFRYIHDPRRRRQFLVLRRFIMGFFITLVIIMGFVSEFSSLATFAGFVTAGLAVGLQTVLLSVAAYFFVIGRYGIRVGDRITVAGVTGDVIDLGLVRFYLMEYSTTGVELYPTGRIVVFSNSVLFQATTPLFKQLPGTHYTWHEVVLPLNVTADHELLQKSIYDAVDSAFKEYSKAIEWQRGLDSQMEIALRPPVPEERLQFSDSGPELVVRYPVDLHRAPEVDDKITRAVIQAIAKDQRVASGVSGAPKIRATVKA